MVSKPLSEKEVSTFHALKSRLVGQILEAQKRIHALEQELIQEKQLIHTMEQQIVGGLDLQFRGANHPHPLHQHETPQKMSYQDENNDEYIGDGGDDDGDGDGDGGDDDEDNEDSVVVCDSHRNKDIESNEDDLDNVRDRVRYRHRDGKSTPPKTQELSEKKKRGRPPGSKNKS